MGKITKVIVFVLVAVGLAVIIRPFLKSNLVKPKNQANLVEKIWKPMKSGPEKFRFFPVRAEDLAVPPKIYGLWPYGIKGEDKNSHNEGHPGWDFELKKSAKLYAVDDLKIDQIHPGDHQIAGQNIQVIEASSMLGNHRYHIVYHSVINLLVGEGQEVKMGEPLAEVGYPLSENSAMIHFGIFPPGDSVGSCPSQFFADSLQPLINQMVAKSLDTKTGKPYPSACVGKISREIYEKNYPDRLKHLGGAEQWE